MAKTATTAMRRCIGTKTFGIEPHEAPVADFPAQPSQKDGLGRMCKPHWRQYTNALRKAAVARKVEDAGKAADAASAREVKGPKASTKRERRRTPMAHLPTTTEEIEQTIREVVAE